MKIKEIIKVLPLDTQFKRNLLLDFDELDADQKFDVTNLLWETYTALYHFKLQENTEKALARARDNEETIDKNFYNRIRETTEKEMTEEDSKTAEQFDITTTRSALEDIMKKIKVSN